MNWALHFHLIAAIAWIGGGFLMFVLGITLRNKEDQDAVYPRIGPIYGYYETGALIILLITGTTMIYYNGLITILFSSVTNEVIDALRTKLYVVAVIVLLTIIHMTVSMMTIHKVKHLYRNSYQRAHQWGYFYSTLWSCIMLWF